MPKSVQRLKRWLSFWELFVGLGVVAGASMMLYDPSGKAFGMNLMLRDIQILPFSAILFQDFIFCGLALLIVNGVSNFVAYILLNQKNRYAGIAGMGCGVILMLWTTVQFVILPLNPLTTLYFIFGVLQAYAGWRYYNSVLFLLNRSYW